MVEHLIKEVVYGYLFYILLHSSLPPKDIELLGVKIVSYNNTGTANDMPTDDGVYFRVGTNGYKLHLFKATSASGGKIYNQLTSGDSPASGSWVEF